MCGQSRCCKLCHYHPLLLDFLVVPLCQIVIPCFEKCTAPGAFIHIHNIYSKLLAEFGDRGNQANVSQISELISYCWWWGEEVGL